MTNAQAERAINQLYESDTMRSELRDEEASLLLSWGEARLSELADRNLPEDQFNELSDKFRALLVAINVCVGKRKTSPSQHLTMMASISSAAEAAGYTIAPSEQTTFLQQQSVLSNQDAISELLGLMKPLETPPPPPSQNIGEAVAEIVVPQAAPAITESAPRQPEPEPVLTEDKLPLQPEPEPVLTEDKLPLQPEPEPVLTEDKLPLQPEPEPVLTEDKLPLQPEPMPAVIENVTPPQPEPEPVVTENVTPPQPEELPEQPDQPPQEG